MEKKTGYSYETSLPAYQKAQESIADCQAAVLDTIKLLCRLHKEKRCFEAQVSESLRWDRNKVTPRINELFLSGKIERLEQKFDNGRGKKVYWYKVVQQKAEQATQQDLFNSNDKAA
jgi:predicted transcriptional regulator